MNRNKNIPIPPHQKGIKNFYKIGDSGGYFDTFDKVIDDEKRGFRFNQKKSNYHKDRFRALKLILKRNLNLKNSKTFKVLDFGIGSGEDYLKLNLNSKHITGIDASPHMIKLAKKKIINLDYHIGGVEKLKKLKSNYFDIVMSNNVLGYLSEKHESIFFKEVKRVTKKNGFLLIMNGNELFDLFNLNAGTSDFFIKYFDQSKKNMKILLKKHNSKKLINARRYNPLNFKYIVKKYGFNEIDQTFSQWHKISTEITKIKYKDLKFARLVARDHIMDPNKLNDLNMWKNLFKCSIFVSLSKKN